MPENTSVSLNSGKEKLFYDRLRDVFIGAKIEGQGGFINLMKIKSNYCLQK